MMHSPHTGKFTRSGAVTRMDSPITSFLSSPWVHLSSLLVKQTVHSGIGSTAGFHRRRAGYPGIDTDSGVSAMLSQFERRELERIEAWFRQADPRFARALAQGTPPAGSLRGRAGRAVADGLTTTLLLLGLATANVFLLLAGTAGLAFAAWLHQR